MSAVDRAGMLSATDDDVYHMCRATHLIVKLLPNSIAFVQEPCEPSDNKHRQRGQHWVLCCEDEHSVCSTMQLQCRRSTKWCIRVSKQQSIQV